MENEFTLTAEVTEYVPIFAAPAEPAPDAPAQEDAFEFIAPVVVLDAPVAVVDAPLVEAPVDVLPTETEVAPASQSIMPGFADYLTRPYAEWTEGDWSQQLFGDTAHHWADFGFA